ncbi:hypothetical protein WT26_10630 [Burkholderia cepacia]|uniref:Uncharacterized protein n=1 Tax=Burkholderia cepacia TaxID=292 RepID=A0A1B4PRC0_BURCE|nr:hypothetical protein WT26_10630 [Burkholderia cepacia]
MSGIGAAAQAFAQRGATVTIASRDPHKATAVAASPCGLVRRGQWAAHSRRPNDKRPAFRRECGAPKGAADALTRPR